MKKNLSILLVLIGISSGIVFATPPVTSNYWKLKVSTNIDDLIGVGARGGVYGDYGNVCTVTDGIPSAGCGLNPSGQRDAMQFDYESGGGVINRVGFFSDGRIAIDTTAPSDGSQSYLGQELEFDVEGAVGAQYYCNEDGLFCYTAAELRQDIVIVANNSAWPGSPANKEMVFNRVGRTIQIYDSSVGEWQPTYTKFMPYNASQIASLSPAPEVGDQVRSTDCGIVLTYAGSAWLDLANNEINTSTCQVVSP